jgi:hypothetical protein
MKNPLRPNRNFFRRALPGLFIAAACSAAITPTEWQNRQTLNVTAPGLTKLVLPAATLDSAQPQLGDVRVLDAAGQEVAYLLDRETRGAEPARRRDPKDFRLVPNGDTTQLVIETGTKEILEAVELETFVPFFLKAAHVEISDDRTQWRSIGTTLPVFRQFGAEQLRLPLGHRTAAFVRVTLDDFRSRQVAFTGARLFAASGQPTPVPVAPFGARITRREEFANETVLTVTLDGRNVSLASLALDVKDPLFARRVTVAVREAWDITSLERTIGTATIYRLALDGTPAKAQLEVPLYFSPVTRELLVHVDNGDSPPLSVGDVRVQQHPAVLLFNAPTAGAYTLLSGNAQVPAPRYDLAAFAGEMKKAPATEATCGEMEAMPNYRPRDSLATAPLPDVPLAGAPIDVKAWSTIRAVKLAAAGVQELELDPAALAGARVDFGDLRLVHDGKQIPYVLEQPLLARSLALKPVAVADAKRPGVSVWRLDLPEAGLPLRRLILTTTTPLFQRQVRIVEKLTNANGGAEENSVAAGAWNRTPEPGVPETKSFELKGRLQTSTLWVEMDNGDNPAIALSAVQAAYPVVRLVFKTAKTEGFALAYGNPESSAPRYDLSLVAGKLVVSSRNIAEFAPGPALVSRQTSKGISGGAAFWGALALVVIVLLVTVAKLLPKPNPPAK